jgi:hypothetical protein
MAAWLKILKACMLKLQIRSKLFLGDPTTLEDLDLKARRGNKLRVLIEDYVLLIYMPLIELNGKKMV